MKRNLLTLLVAFGLVASVSACGGKKGTETETGSGTETQTETDTGTEEEVAKELKIEEATGLELTDDFRLVATHEGELVTVKNLQFATKFGKRLLAQFYYPGADGKLSSKDAYGIEVELADGVEFKQADGSAVGYTDLINVTGRVATENKKVVIKEATFEYVEKGDGRNFYFDATRATVDGVLSAAQYNGLCLEGTFQVVSLPTITAENGGKFQVVFPGEKTEVSTDNDFLIDMHIPGGLTDAQVANYNEKFKDIEVGDGLRVIFVENYRGGFAGLLPPDFIGRKFVSNDELWFEEVELDILSSFDDVLDGMSDYFDADLYEGFEPEGGYSYTLNIDKTDHSKESYIAINQKYDVVGEAEVMAYTDKPSEDAKAILDAINGVKVEAEEGDRMWALGGLFTADGGEPTSWDEVAAYVYVLVDYEAEEEDTEGESSALLFDTETSEEEEDEAVYAQAQIDVGESSLQFQFWGELLTPTHFDSKKLADIEAFYNENLYSKVMPQGSTSAAFGAEGPFAISVASKYSLSFNAWDSIPAQNPGVNLYQTSLTITVPTSAVATLELNFDEEVWAEKEINALSLEGYYSKASHEFIAIRGARKDAEDEAISYIIVTIIVDVDEKYVSDPLPVYGTAAEATAEYVTEYAKIMTGVTPTAHTLIGSALDAEGMHFKPLMDNWSTNAAYGIYIFAMDVYSYATQEAFNAAANALVTALTGAGYKAATLAALKITSNAFYNETTHELVAIKVYQWGGEEGGYEIYVRVIIDVNGAYVAVNA